MRYPLYCTLKPGVDRATIVKGVGELAFSRGVLDYSAGYKVVPQLGPDGDDFDVGVYLTFGNETQLNTFLTSEPFARVRDTVLTPNCDQVLAYAATIELYDYGAETEEATRKRRAASLELQREIINRR